MDSYRIVQELREEIKENEPFNIEIVLITLIVLGCSWLVAILKG